MGESKLARIFLRNQHSFSNKCVSPASRIPAHRNVLYAGSVYFKTMFATDLRERGEWEVSIQCVAGGILQKLVEYCYGQEIAINSGNVEQLAEAATMLQFTRVHNKCAEFYSMVLNATNCLGVRKFAELHNMVNLQENARHLALNSFVEVSKCEEFHQLNVVQLTALLEHDELNVSGEEEVFNALIGWINYDVNGRRQTIRHLSDCVRFQYVDDSVSK